MYHEMNVFPKVVLHSRSNSGWVRPPLDHLSYTKASMENSSEVAAVTDYNGGAISALCSHSAKMIK